MSSRWLKFGAVGALGIAAQLAVLWLLSSRLGVSSLPATALAVECAILHNFAWHECWTWRDRAAPTAGPRANRLLRFQLSAGLISMVCNLAGMRLLAGVWHAPYLAANVVCIVGGGMANFMAADRFVFRRRAEGP